MKNRKNLYQGVSEISYEKTEDDLTMEEKVYYEIWKEIDLPSQEIIKEFTELNVTADNIFKQIRVVKWILISVVAALLLIVIK